jgi:hypothetical protein
MVRVLSEIVISSSCCIGAIGTAPTLNKRHRETGQHASSVADQGVGCLLESKISSTHVAFLKQKHNGALYLKPSKENKTKKNKQLILSKFHVQYVERPHTRTSTHKHMCMHPHEYKKWILRVFMRCGLEQTNKQTTKE